jgi:hypothetical protein
MDHFFTNCAGPEKKSCPNGMIVVYMMGVSAAFFMAVDMLNITMLLKKVITVEARLRQTNSMWMFYGAVVMNTILMAFCGLKTTVAYIIFTGLFKPTHYIIPSWCFAKHKANQKSLKLLEGENAGINVALLVQGTKMLVY